MPHSLEEAYRRTFNVVPMTCPEVRRILDSLTQDVIRDPNNASKYTIAAFVAIRNITTALRDAWVSDVMTPGTATRHQEAKRSPVVILTDPPVIPEKVKTKITGKLIPEKVKTKITGRYRSMTGEVIPCVLLKIVDAHTVRLQVNLPQATASVSDRYTHGQIIDAESHLFAMDIKKKTRYKRP